jgi:hypothetical protein
LSELPPELPASPEPLPFGDKNAGILLGSRVVTKCRITSWNFRRIGGVCHGSEHAQTAGDALAKELAENYVLQHDMHTSLATIKLWFEKYAEKSRQTEEGIIGQSLFRDAIIQFVGCFDKTAPFPLSPDKIYGHDPSGIKSFEWFKDTRDAYAAHKFGAQRQCVVGVVLTPQGEIGIGHLQVAYKGQNKSDGPQLLGFMQTAAKFLDQKIASLEKTLLESVRVMTKEQISSLRVATVRTLEQSESRISRPALQKALSAVPPPIILDE